MSFSCAWVLRFSNNFKICWGRTTVVGTTECNALNLPITLSNYANSISVTGRESETYLSGYSCTGKIMSNSTINIGSTRSGTNSVINYIVVGY